MEFRATLLVVLVANAVNVTSSVSAPVVNFYGRDDVVALRTRAPTARCPSRAAPCLQPLELLQITAPNGESGSVLSLPSDCLLPVHEDDTQELDGLLGIGALTLSADSRFVSLICGFGTAGGALSSATQAVVVLVSADKTIDAATRWRLPSIGAGLLSKRPPFPFSAVTENGTGLWLAGSEGLLYAPAGLDLGFAAPVVLFSTPSPVTLVSIVNGSSLVFTSGGAVRVWTPSAPPPPGQDGAFDSLPRSADAFASRGTVSVLATVPTALTHALAQYGRGGTRHVGDQLDVRWSASHVPVTPSAAADGAFLYVGALHAPNAESGAVFRPDDSAAVAPGGGSSGGGGELTGLASLPWLPHAKEPRITLDNAGLTAYAAAQASRWGSRHTLVYLDTTTCCLGLPIYGASNSTALVFGSIFATTQWSVLNHTLTDRPQMGQHPDTVRTRAMATVPSWERNWRRFYGVSLAPLDSSLPAPIPTVLPTPTTPVEFVSPSRSPAATGTLSPTSTEFGRGFSLRDFGLPIGTSLRNPWTQYFTDWSQQQLLLLRVGAPSSTPYNRSDALLAAPLFIDVYDVVYKNVSQRVAFGTTHAGTQRPCTAPLGTPRLWPLMHTKGQDPWTAVPCYEVEPGRGIIPDAYEPPDADAARGTAAERFPWVHPTRVIASVYSKGATAYVGSSTIMPPACNASVIKVAYMIEVGGFGPVAYTSGAIMRGAPQQLHGKCGMRFVPLGNDGTLDAPLVEPQLEHAIGLIASEKQTYAWIDDGADEVFNAGERQHDTEEVFHDTEEVVNADAPRSSGGLLQLWSSMIRRPFVALALTCFSVVRAVANRQKLRILTRSAASNGNAANSNQLALYRRCIPFF